MGEKSVEERSRPSCRGVGVASAKHEVHEGSDFNMLQTWQSDLNLSQNQWERKVREKEGEKRQWLREGLEPVTWQMACHALTNWTNKSLGNSVTEFEYLRLSCQGSSWSRGVFPRDQLARNQFACGQCVLHQPFTWSTLTKSIKVRSMGIQVKG